MDLDYIDHLRTDFKKETGKYPTVLVIDEFFVDELADDIAHSVIVETRFDRPVRQTIVEELYAGKFNYRGTLIVPETTVLHAQGGGFFDEGDHSN